MLKNRLNLTMDHFVSGGPFLTIEEQLLLQLSLPILQQENKLSVSFHGKIFGTNNDYYIAQGRGEDFIRNKLSFYSLDGTSWRLLFPPPDKDISAFHLIRTRFTGDPMWEHSYYGENEEKAFIKEENRLSALVKLMDFETAIGPKNALMVNSRGIINKNPYFKGLPKTEAIELSSYLHYRLPDSNLSISPTTVVCPPGGDRARQFLEPIILDYPVGCWILQSDHLREKVSIRNLWWPGYRFYHIPSTGEYNGIYMGYGERNDDLPFML